MTYVDDGRVLDTPEDLTQAFQHAIETEVALKGFDLTTELKLFRSKDGQVENLDGSSSDEDDDVEMFACEICDGLVKETDNECPHCGAVFEDEDEEEVVESPPRRTPPRRGGPPGPSKGGPPKKSGPPGPSKGGPPKGGPPKKSGPPGPSKGGPPKGGPPKKSGPPGPSKGGPPKGGPPKGGPSGPKRGPPR